MTRTRDTLEQHQVVPDADMNTADTASFQLRADGVITGVSLRCGRHPSEPPRGAHLTAEMPQGGPA